MIDELFTRFDGVFAESTVRGYRADFRHFNRWCDQYGYSPLDANSEQLAAYLEDLANHYATPTIERHMYCIGTLMRLSGRKDVSKEAPTVLAMKRIKRRKHSWKKQSVPLTSEVLDGLLNVCGDDALGQRDRVILRLGYHTMRRRSELCEFRFEDLVHLPNGRSALCLHFSKSDQFGEGKLIPITDSLLNEIQAWAAYTGGTGFLLRRMYRHGDIGSSLHPDGINRRLKELQALAGLDLGGPLSGQSFRVGAALDLLNQGVSLQEIMLRGGWNAKSTVIKYLRNWQAIQDTVAPSNTCNP